MSVSLASSNPNAPPPEEQPSTEEWRGEEQRMTDFRKEQEGRRLVPSEAALDARQDLFRREPWRALAQQRLNEQRARRHTAVHQEDSSTSVVSHRRDGSGGSSRPIVMPPPDDEAGVAVTPADTPPLPGGGTVTRSSPVCTRVPLSLVLGLIFSVGMMTLNILVLQGKLSPLVACGANLPLYLGLLIVSTPATAGVGFLGFGTIIAFSCLALAGYPVGTTGITAVALAAYSLAALILAALAYSKLAESH